MAAPGAGIKRHRAKTKKKSSSKRSSNPRLRTQKPGTVRTISPPSSSKIQISGSAAPTVTASSGRQPTPGRSLDTSLSEPRTETVTTTQTQQTQVMQGRDFDPVPDSPLEPTRIPEDTRRTASEILFAERLSTVDPEFKVTTPQRFIEEEPRSRAFIVPGSQGQPSTEFTGRRSPGTFEGFTERQRQTGAITRQLRAAEEARTGQPSQIDVTSVRRASIPSIAVPEGAREKPESFVSTLFGKRDVTLVTVEGAREDSKSITTFRGGRVGEIAAFAVPISSNLLRQETEIRSGSRIGILGQEGTIFANPGRENITGIDKLTEDLGFRSVVTDRATRAGERSRATGGDVFMSDFVREEREGATAFSLLVGGVVAGGSTVIRPKSGGSRGTSQTTVSEFKGRIDIALERAGGDRFNFGRQLELARAAEGTEQLPPQRTLTRNIRDTRLQEAKEFSSQLDRIEKGATRRAELQNKPLRSEDVLKSDEPVFKPKGTKEFKAEVERMQPEVEQARINSEFFKEQIRISKEQRRARGEPELTQADVDAALGSKPTEFFPEFKRKAGGGKKKSSRPPNEAARAVQEFDKLIEESAPTRRPPKSTIEEEFITSGSSSRISGGSSRIAQTPRFRVGLVTIQDQRTSGIGDQRQIQIQRSITDTTVKPSQLGDFDLVQDITGDQDTGQDDDIINIIVPGFDPGRRRPGPGDPGITDDPFRRPDRPGGPSITNINIGLPDFGGGFQSSSRRSFKRQKRRRTPQVAAAFIDVPRGARGGVFTGFESRGFL